MRKLIIGFIIIIIGAIGVLLWWSNGLLPANPNDKTQKMFVVQKGASIREVANSMKKEGLIKDPVVFFLLIKKLGLDGKIQAGDFKLSPSESAEEIAKSLTKGTLDIWITIPEGLRAEEIADILKEKIPSFQESWREQLDVHEGNLFPDTYLIPREAEIDTIISIMTNNFGTQFTKVTNKTSLSDKELVTVASMVEREAKFEEDRPLVASVILNRLKIGMPLQIDSTIQYALGYQNAEKTWWKKDLTTGDLKLISPYNTYLNTGLPPTPISNPGLSVLQAVANPAQTDYLYYISDKSGHNHYAKTGAEHNANIQKYGL